MLISEKIELLRLYPEKGRPYLDLSPDIPPASFLIDLFLRGNISFKEKKVKIINRDTDNPLLDEPIKMLLAKGLKGDGFHKVGTAIKLLNAKTELFTEREVYKHYVNEGILRLDATKRSKLYFNQEDVQQNIISDIKKTTLQIEKPDVADYFVLRTLKMGHLLKRYFSKQEIKEIKELLKKDPIQIGIETNIAGLIESVIKELRRRNMVH